eukprot:sb/3461970/
MYNPGHILSNSTIAVDWFSNPGCPFVSHYFCSSADCDQSSHLTGRWTPYVYCSSTTAKMLAQLRGFKNTISLPYNKATMIDGLFTVTMLFSNYHVGTAMFYFEGPFGRILYSGSFRYYDNVCSLFTGITLDHIYFDNLYFNKKSIKSITRQQAIYSITETCLLALQQNKILYFIVDELGKEDILYYAARTIGQRFVVSKAKFDVLKCMELDDYFTTNPYGGRVFVVDKKRINSKKSLPEIIKRHYPTPVQFVKITHQKRGATVAEYDYMIFSEHSTSPEIEQFFGNLAYRSVTPIFCDSPSRTKKSSSGECSSSSTPPPAKMRLKKVESDTYRVASGQTTDEEAELVVGDFSAPVVTPIIACEEEVVSTAMAGFSPCTHPSPPFSPCIASSPDTSRSYIERPVSLSSCELSPIKKFLPVHQGEVTEGELVIDEEATTPAAPAGVITPGVAGVTTPTPAGVTTPGGVTTPTPSVTTPQSSPVYNSISNTEPHCNQLTPVQQEESSPVQQELHHQPSPLPVQDTTQPLHHHSSPVQDTTQPLHHLPSPWTVSPASNFKPIQMDDLFEEMFKDSIIKEEIIPIAEEEVVSDDSIEVLDNTADSVDVLYVSESEEEKVEEVPEIMTPLRQMYDVNTAFNKSAWELKKLFDGYQPSIATLEFPPVRSVDYIPPPPYINPVRTDQWVKDREAYFRKITRIADRGRAIYYPQKPRRIYPTPPAPVVPGPTQNEIREFLTMLNHDPNFQPPSRPVLQVAKAPCYLIPPKPVQQHQPTPPPPVKFKQSPVFNPKPPPPSFSKYASCSGGGDPGRVSCSGGGDPVRVSKKRKSDSSPSPSLRPDVMFENMFSIAPNPPRAPPKKKQKISTPRPPRSYLC